MQTRDDVAPRAAGQQRSGLFVALLGNLAVRFEGKPAPIAPKRRIVPLLTYLLLHRGESLARDFVAFLLWPEESEEDALTKLRSNIFELNKALPSERDGVPWLLASATSIGWNPAAAVEVDVDRFDAAAADPERLDEAVALYGGDLVESVYDEWIYTERERLRNVLFGALERGVARCWRSGETTRAVAYAQQILARDPFREDIVRRLMAVRDAAGDRSGALAEFRKFEQHARAELGVDPMPETLALRDRIARGEAQVDGAALGGEEQPRPHHGAPQWPLVGREKELDTLLAAWHRARAGRGGVILVGGEAGFGKSRLVAQFAAEAALVGGRVLGGDTSSPEAGPLQAIVEALREALALVAALPLEAVWMRTLATLLPELTVEKNDAELPMLGGEAQAERVHEAVARAILRLARARPLLLVLEDLHWASAATVAALGAIARRIALGPVLIVATYRDDEVDRAHPLAAAMRHMTAAGLAQTMSLRALRPEDVSHLAMLANIPAARAQSVYRATDGNAFFVTQLFASDGDDVMPAGAHGAVTARLERLPEEARHVARIAALAGAHFSREVVQRVAGWSVAEIGDALDVLLERRFVRERSGRGPFDYRFTHEFVREAVLLDAASTPERHRRLARVIEDCHPELAAELAGELASHYERAGCASEAAAKYAQAARRALDLGAFADADDALQRGLAIAPDDHAKAELLVVGADAATLGNFARQRERTNELGRLAGELGDSKLRFEFMIAEARIDQFRSNTFDDELAQRLAALREAAGDDRHLRARADLLEADYCRRLDPVRAIEIAERIVPFFRETEHRQYLADALGIIAVSHALQSRASEAREARAGLLAIAEKGVDYRARLSALRELFTASRMLGDYTRAIDYSKEWADAAIGAGDQRVEVYARQALAWSFLQQFKFGDALVQFERINALVAELALEDFQSSNYAIVLSRVGRFALSRKTLEADLEHIAAESQMRLFNATAPLISVRSECGDLEGAREAARIAIGLAREGKRANDAFEALDDLVEAERRHGNYDIALGHARKMYEQYGASMPLVKPRLRISLAWLLAKTGSADEARAVFSDVRAPALDPNENYWSDLVGLLAAQTAAMLDDDETAQRWLAFTAELHERMRENLDDFVLSDFESAWWSRELAQARAGQWPRPR